MSAEFISSSHSCAVSAALLIGFALRRRLWLVMLTTPLLDTSHAFSAHASEGFPTCYQLKSPLLEFEPSQHTSHHTLADTARANRELRRALLERGVVCPPSAPGLALRLRVLEKEGTSAQLLGGQAPAHVSVTWSVTLEKSDSAQSITWSPLTQLQADRPWPITSSLLSRHSAVHVQLERLLIQDLANVLAARHSTIWTHRLPSQEQPHHE